MIRHVLAVTVALGFCFVSAGCSRRNGPTRLDDGKGEKAAMSDVKSDEEVVFFPTAARLDETTSQWIVPIHGVVCEPEQDSARRAAVVAAIRGAVDVTADTSDGQRLDQRVRLFLVDNERGKDISVRLGAEAYEVGTSEPNGHVQGTLQIPQAQVEQLLAQQENVNGFVAYTAVLKESDNRVFTGCVQCVPPRGLSVISDVDDTIKHTQVGDHKAVLANTFLREFQPIPGMPELYRQWAQQGVVFHYVSGSPWQLYLLLAEFLRTQQYPLGSMNLKYFRLKDPSALDLLQSQEDTKVRAIEPILAAFPQRRFVLIGDSGEQDPEIYTRIAQTHRQHIAAIFIRNVSQEQADNARIAPLRQSLDDVRFELFDQPAGLQPIVAEIGRAEAPAK